MLGVLHPSPNSARRRLGRLDRYALRPGPQGPSGTHDETGLARSRPFKIGQENSVDATRQQSREARLSHAQQKLPQIVAVAHQHVEGVELHLIFVRATVQTVEIRSTVNTEQLGYTVQHE